MPFHEGQTPPGPIRGPLVLKVQSILTSVYRIDLSGTPCTCLLIEFDRRAVFSEISTEKNHQWRDATSILWGDFQKQV